MPNIIIETSRKDLIDSVDTLLALINDTLWQSGHFTQQADIKTRYYASNHCLVGLANASDNATTNDYIFVHFYLMAGRDSNTIKALCQRIITAIITHLNKTTALDNSASGQIQICVNPTMLNADYYKALY